MRPGDRVDVVIGDEPKWVHLRGIYVCENGGRIGILADYPDRPNGHPVDFRIDQVRPERSPAATVRWKIREYRERRGKLLQNRPQRRWWQKSFNRNDALLDVLDVNIETLTTLAEALPDTVSPNCGDEIILSTNDGFARGKKVNARFTKADSGGAPFDMNAVFLARFRDWTFFSMHDGQSIHGLPSAQVTLLQPPPPCSACGK